MASLLEQLIAALDDGAIQVIDLTQPLGAETPVIALPDIFAPSPGVTIREISRYDERGPAWYWNALELGEHTGTHFDAPVHWITGKDLADNTCDTIAPRRFVGPACVLDITREAERDADYLVTPDWIAHWEAQHGRIPRGAWVLLRTGWSRRRDAESFLNADARGPHHPGLTKESSALLAHDRDVLGLGVETIGTDAGQAATFDPPFPNHAIMHGAGKFGLASLCNLERLPATGAVVIAAPLRIVAGSGSPLRVLALVPA